MHVQGYSSLIGGAGLTNPLLAGYDGWLEGPIQWPPIDRQVLGTCPVGVSVINILTRAFSVLGDHIINPKPVPVFAHQRMNATFPSIHRTNSTPLEHGDFASTTSRDSWVQYVLGLIQSFVTDIMGIDIAFFVGFMTGDPQPGDGGLTLSGIFKTLLTCDFENIITCQKKTSNPFVGGLAVLFMLVFFYMMLGSLGGFILGGISVPLLVLWYVYGYSPMCVPLIPECAVLDLIGIVEWIVPVRLEWPDALQKTEGCALNASVPYRDCFISCGEPPFRYRSWESTVAWAACDWDPYWCRTVVTPWAIDNNFPLLWAELIDKFKVIQNDYNNVTGSVQEIQAHRFCFSVTIVNIVPYILLFLALFYAASAVLVLPFVIVQWLIEVFFQGLAYTHMIAPRRTV